jgi:hypothetical protein
MQFFGPNPKIVRRRRIAFNKRDETCSFHSSLVPKVIENLSPPPPPLSLFVLAGKITRQSPNESEQFRTSPLGKVLGFAIVLVSRQRSRTLICQ